MHFRDRADAGEQLADALSWLRDREDVVLLALPRGGVPVAFAMARSLHLPLDIFPARKLGVPSNEELAFGAVTLDGGRWLDAETVRYLGLQPDQIEAITERTLALLAQRAGLYRQGQPALDVTGKTVVLVDDGVATGASVLAAIPALRKLGAREVIVAAPVAPPSTYARLRREADRVIVLATPSEFRAVGQFYTRFDQTSDEEVLRLLALAHTQSKG